MNLTPSQHRAVTHRGSNLLVAASAGSGKTEVLARRCADLVADEVRPCRVDELLVVTFTRAAAAELRVRVARMLREKAEEASAPRWRRHLRQQALLVDMADIGTIDAWCGRLVREHFEAADVDVAFATLSPEDAALLRRSELDALFDELYRAKSAFTAEVRAWLARSAIPTDDFLRELVLRLNRIREHVVNPEQWFAWQRTMCERSQAAQLLATELQEECAFQHAQLEQLLGGQVDAATRSRLDPYAAALADWNARLADPGALVDVATSIDGFKFPVKKRGADEAPIMAEVKERWHKRRLKARWGADVVTPILTHERQIGGLLATLLQLEEAYHGRLESVKRQRAAWEFGDILRRTLDILGTPTNGVHRQPTVIAQRLQQRYAHILVDEYQDTSPVQVEVLRLITRQPPNDGNRFMVGDVKQSIYGFRQAEPRLFSDLIDAFESGREPGRVEYLADNFRSHGGLLDGLNRMFARLFDRALGGTSFGVQERLSAGRDEIENPSLAGLPRIAVDVLEDDGEADAEDADDASAIERIEREAQLVADRIRGLLERGARAVQRGPDQRPVLAPVRYADTAVLLRSVRGQVGLVARVLRANGIPCVTSGQEALLDGLEVQDVCHVLRLLVNRQQDVSLAAYLRGPFVGLTPAELCELREIGPRGAGLLDAVTRYAERGAGAVLRARVADALAQLDRWAVAAREQEVPTLLRRILSESGLLLFARALRGGDQRVALLRALQQVAQAFGTVGPGVAEFVAHLDALADEDIALGAPAAGSDDAVRIMSIHRAKGLEFPVVFLLGAGARFNRQSQADALQFDEEVGVGLRFGDYHARAMLTSAAHLIARQRISKRETEEELRLLYVAATRAREHLGIIGHSKPGRWGALCEQYGAMDALPLISRLSVNDRLEWVLMAAAADRRHGEPSSTQETGGTTAPRIDVTVRAAADVMPRTSAADARRETAALPLSPEDGDWVARGQALLNARLDRTLAELPAVLSVSAAKQLARRDDEADQPRLVGVPATQLGAPRFASVDTADGRARGTAVHQFLELAAFEKLTAVAAIRDELRHLCEIGRMTADDAALVSVDDVAWLMATELGTLLRAEEGRIEREVPFVFGVPLGAQDERAIVRGVIDCLVHTNDGLLIVDYKTDAVRDAADLEQRLRGYRVQMQMYAWAAGDIYQRPVQRLVLAFVRARRLVDVPVELPDFGAAAAF